MVFELPSLPRVLDALARRPDYMKTLLENLINWDSANQNFA